MKKPTQKIRVENKLLESGYITRNQCLRNYISRLSAIIQVLESEGWIFETQDKKGDYVYTVKACPFKRLEYKLPNGEIITKYRR